MEEERSGGGFVSDEVSNRLVVWDLWKLEVVVGCVEGRRRFVERVMRKRRRMEGSRELRIENGERGFW